MVLATHGTRPAKVARHVRSLWSVVGTVLIVFFPAATGACRILSDTSIVATVASPDGSILADWYQISGGGGAGWSEDRVRLRKQGEEFKAAADPIFIAISADKLLIEWNGNDHLKILYPRNTDITKSQPTWNSVSITYAEDPDMKRY